VPSRKRSSVAISQQLQIDATGRGITATGLATLQTAALRNNSIKQNTADVYQVGITAARNRADAAMLQKIQQAPDGAKALSLAAAAGYGTSTVQDLITKYPDAGIQPGDAQTAQQEGVESPTHSWHRNQCLITR
jgi:hypothetical protein